MPQIALNDADIGPLVNQSISATVQQHVGMNRQMFEAGSRSHLPDHYPHGATTQRFAPFADEKRVAIRGRCQFRALNEPRFDCRRFTVVKFVRPAIATLEPFDVEFAGFDVDVRELQGAQLRNPQTVPKH